MKTMVFDTETTGLPVFNGALEVQPHIIELGAMVFENGELVCSYSQMVRPPHAIDATITKITGIKNEDLADKPTFAEVWPAFRELLSSCDMLIAHNAEFDVSLMGFELTRLGVDPATVMPREIIDTVAEFHHLFGRRMKLTELYEKTIGKPLAQTHRALDDVAALAEVCKASGLLCLQTTG